MAAKLFLASSNPGKLAEFRVLAKDSQILLGLDLLPGFDSLPAFEESAPTFAENSAGKALYYSQLTHEAVIADDSGLVVPSLDGRPGVQSARYAGPDATSAQRIEKLLGEMAGKNADERAAHFVCALSVVKQNRALIVITARADGEILQSQRGEGGFGYDPVFYFPPLRKTFAELTPGEKNQYSHRGKAFRRLLSVLPDVL
ncbi:MAG: RdgB/HAM1 family non-canonical purine NTP pyrophosphatase [Acidobacteria bacterium]|nr:RdgB/HAM1 family non-canonical purine NTP pyrophosphatase [Acidobacteriota bacterium]MBS1867728.1 RdgB/HAM1 family non-canonical purine NTP pyrophosphatase [Acidobacteriota bacterium]